MDRKKCPDNARPAVCTAKGGWPHGYPVCDTARGSNVNPTAPDFFVYCSPPSPVNMNDISGIKQRPQYRNNVPKPRGVHSYYNVMWDGRVCRGDPSQVKQRQEEERQKILQRLNQPRKTVGMQSKSKKKKSQGGSRKSRMLADQNTNAEILRYSTLAIASLCAKDPDKYLVDLSDEIDVQDPCYKGRRLQTLRTFPIAPSRKTNLVDFGTQIFPGEFFDFEGEAMPIIEKLIGSVVEQAHLEVLEEAEVEAMNLQRKLYEEKIEHAHGNIERWAHREKKVKAERKRLRDAERQLESGMDEAMKLYQICAYTGGLTKDAIAECVESLRKEGFIFSQEKAIAAQVEQELLPALNQQILEEINVHRTSRFILDGLIEEVVNRREAEYAEAIWREVYEQGPLKKYEDENRAPPPTPGTSLYETEESGDESSSDPTYQKNIDEE